MNTTVSVCILSDQLLASHPALVAAAKAVGRDNVRTLLVERAQRSQSLDNARQPAGCQPR